MCATLPKSKKKAEEVSVGVGENGNGKDCTRQSDGQEEREYGKDMSWGDCHLCLNQRASAINVYDYGLGSGRFTLHMCCTLHMIPAIARDGN